MLFPGAMCTSRKGDTKGVLIPGAGFPENHTMGVGGGEVGEDGG